MGNKILRRAGPIDPIFASRENSGLILSFQQERELNRQVAEFAKDFRAADARNRVSPPLGGLITRPYRLLPAENHFFLIK